MSARGRKQGTMIGGEATKYLCKSPKFGPCGTKHGTKSERKRRSNHKNRRDIELGKKEMPSSITKGSYLYCEGAAQNPPRYSIHKF